VTHIELFVLLQVLDFLTTLVGLRMGGKELSPFIAWLMHMADPIVGLTAAKVVGFALGGYCIWKRKMRVIHWVNYVFVVLVVWNVLNILRAVILTS
jgi:hypothetical protein